MKLFLHLFFCLFISAVHAVELQPLLNAVYQGPNPFSYPLDIKVYSDNPANENVVLCCHGYGGDSSIASVIASHKIVPAHLIGFNFPDYRITSRSMYPSQIAYGTIDELLPAIYLLKKIVIDAKTDKVSLYGFSAGGAAVVNLIALLNTDPQNPRLLSLGINDSDVQKILAALQKGIILLDAPLKSIEEYTAAHPGSMRDPLHAMQSRRYAENGMNPIDSIAKWQDLNLSVSLFFQNPDQALSNRDDALFIERLQQVNPNGRNVILSGNEGGHLGFHYSLWKAYSQLSEKTN